MRARHPHPLRRFATLLWSLAACGPADVDTQPEAEALDSTDGAVTEAALMLLAGDGILSAPAAPQGSVAAQLAAQRVLLHYRPAGCASASVDGATVTYAFQGCRALSGVIDHLTGTLAVRFESGAGRDVVAHGRADGLRVGGATVDLDLDARYTVDVGALSLAVQTRSSGVGARRVTFARDGRYTLRWEPSPQCAQLDGDWTTRTPRATSRTTVSALRRCMGRCPQFGGSVAFVSGSPPLTVTTTFTGGATAQWQRSDGRAGTLALDCTN